MRNVVHYTLTRGQPRGRLAEQGRLGTWLESTVNLGQPRRRAPLLRNLQKPGQNPPIPRPPAPILPQTQRSADSQILRETICPRYDSREECSNRSGPLATGDPRDARTRTVETTKTYENTRRSLSTSRQTSDSPDPCTRGSDGGHRRTTHAPACGMAPPTADDSPLPSPQETQYAPSSDWTGTRLRPSTRGAQTEQTA